MVSGTAVVNRQDRVLLKPVTLFAQQHQFLVPRGTDRNNHPATVFELLDERRRHLLRCTGDNNGVEWRSLRPAFVAVTGAHRHIGVTEPLEVGLSPPGQVLDDLDRIDLRY